MALFTCNGPEKERPATILSCAPKFLMLRSQVFLEGLGCVPAEIGLAKAGADGVHYDSCPRQWYQGCEMTDRQDLE